MGAHAVAEGPSKAAGLSGRQLDDIRNCYNDDRVALDSMLDKHGLSSTLDKHEALLKVMGIGENDAVFYSGCTDDYDIDQDQYEAIVGAFFSGFWQHKAT